VSSITLPAWGDTVRRGGSEGLVFIVRLRLRDPTMGEPPLPAAGQSAIYVGDPSLAGGVAIYPLAGRIRLENAACRPGGSAADGLPGAAVCPRRLPGAGGQAPYTGQSCGAGATSSRWRWLRGGWEHEVGVRQPLDRLRGVQGPRIAPN